MWIVKGILLGVVIFLVAGISYTVIRAGITIHRLQQSAKGASGLYASNLGWFIHQPIVWAALLISVAIGIWIVSS
jgi:hypothetical protein